MKIGAILAAAALLAPAAAAQDIYTQDFESGLGGWAVGSGSGGVNWSVDKTPSAESPTNSLNVNNGTDYAGAINTLTAASPDIGTQSYTTLTVSFWCNFRTEFERTGEENQHDLRTMVIGSGSTIIAFYQFMNPQGPTSIPYFTSASPVTCDQPGTWHTHEFQVNLTGQSSINLSYYFWTEDTQFNAHEGWFVDDVKVTGPGGTSGGGGGGWGGTGGSNGAGWGSHQSGPDDESGKSGCGMVGWDALLLLGGIWALRRRRRNS